jgi:HPt (histidine-containing phosphotransfer) domain-containing protein
MSGFDENSTPAERLDAYRTELAQKEATIEDILKERRDLWNRAEAAENKVKELEDWLRHYERTTVPISEDGRWVFIDGPGDALLLYSDEVECTEKMLRAAEKAVIAEWDQMMRETLPHGAPLQRWPVSPTNWRILRAGWRAMLASVYEKGKEDGTDDERLHPEVLGEEAAAGDTAEGDDDRGVDLPFARRLGRRGVLRAALSRLDALLRR